MDWISTKMISRIVKKRVATSDGNLLFEIEPHVVHLWGLLNKFATSTCFSTSSESWYATCPFLSPSLISTFWKKKKLPSWNMYEGPIKYYPRLEEKKNRKWRLCSFDNFIYWTIYRPFRISVMSYGKLR